MATFQHERYDYNYPAVRAQLVRNNREMDIFMFFQDLKAQNGSWKVLNLLLGGQISCYFVDFIAAFDHIIFISLVIN